MGKSIDRRAFLKGSIAAGALGAASLGLVGCNTSNGATGAEGGESQPFELGVTWDSEYDVVVVGFGGAGAASAITAADNGSKVLLLEKAPTRRPGGSSAVCMQWICYTEDKVGLLKYFQALRVNFETPSDDLLNTYIDGVAQNKDWVTSIGAPNPTTFTYLDFPDFPGADAFTPLTVNGRTEDPANLLKQDGAAYRLLKSAVVSRSDSIDVWYEARGNKLVQDPVTKVIHGVVAEVEGADRTIRARNGVILTCGGFENNKDMQQDFLQRTFNPSLGRALWNEGDGIKMAMEVGADLWHMSNCVTNNGEFFDWDTMTATFAFSKPGIMVGNDGTRIASVRNASAHGKTWVSGTWTNANFPDELWTVFDQNIKDTKTFNQCWTKDLSYETAKGWVLQADTLQELGKKMGFTDDASATLADTVAKYNGYCADGFDPQWQIPPTSLLALASPPYYAIKLQVCFTNTQGGPRKNERGEILDIQGNPVPHLYESGELGDIWSNLYQASNNLGGGLVFGRISGANAATPKTDNYQDSVMGGKAGYKPTVTEKTYDAAAGQYIGKGRGRGLAPLVVRLTVQDDKIANVEVLEHYESDGLPKVAIALDSIPKSMVDTNSANIDVVSGATLTT
ncbi:MAG: FAD-binding protein, partial [Eggerthellaceae bacterium]|nr:FAD-binding protein [Eggerthellaceae bacterium]